MNPPRGMVDYATACRKRPRIEVADLPLRLRPQHPTIWFGDGNVILATATMLFRVHRGVLSYNSTIFRDMFSIHQPPGGGGGDEMMDDLPVVHLSDEEKDLTYLLRALYDRT